MSIPKESVHIIVQIIYMQTCFFQHREQTSTRKHHLRTLLADQIIFMLMDNHHSVQQNRNTTFAFPPPSISSNFIDVMCAHLMHGVILHVIEC